MSKAKGQSPMRRAIRQEEGKQNKNPRSSTGRVRGKDLHLQGGLHMHGGGTIDFDNLLRLMNARRKDKNLPKIKKLKIKSAPAPTDKN